MKTSDDLPYDGNNFTHPEVAMAKSISRQALAEALGSPEAGREVRKGIPDAPKMGLLDTHKSEDTRSGLPGGNELLPSVDPAAPADSAEREAIWQARLRAANPIVSRSGGRGK